METRPLVVEMKHGRSDGQAQPTTEHPSYEREHGARGTGQSDIPAVSSRARFAATP
jgi:hypothetical protein